MWYKTSVITLIFLFMSGCQTTEDIWDWAVGDDEEVQTVVKSQTQTLHEYVTVNIKDKIAVKVADPLGPRATGVGCAMWKSKSGESGRCCWNAKGQCFCPCPE
ncbi:MAG: hypothetical protein CMD90_00395 [Gammaproteobacteria bacterium]|nr:hypothetical protein [Gammaproteobacteria bacterium]